MEGMKEAQLRELYGLPAERARKKVLSELEEHSLNFISLSPFLVVSSTSSDGRMDASPRGGDPGFVKVSKDQLFIPDFKGNNRIDSLINISQTGRVGLLFMIPGIDETLRVNGSATITTDPAILSKVDDNGKSPLSCIVVQVEEVFLHCAKAFMRSALWSDKNRIDPKNFPSIGQMIKDQLKLSIEAESREDMIKRYSKDL